MLSYLYRLVTDYQRSHGCHPNLVYLNRLHYFMLRQNLAGLRSEEAIVRFLGMNIVISPEICHPDVAWVTSARQKSAGRLRLPASRDTSAPCASSALN